MSATAKPALSTVGVPKEIKGDERRVALTPDGAAELVGVGCEVRRARCRNRSGLHR